MTTGMEKDQYPPPRRGRRAHPTPARLTLAVGILALLPALVASGSELDEGTAPPEVIFRRASVGDVEFPHALHTEDVGVDCVECHHETNAARLDIPHEAYFNDSWTDCQCCHQGAQVAGKSRACSACHPASPTGIADESMSSKVVIHIRCWQCHEIGVGAEASRECAFCHQASRAASGTGTAFPND
jgi:c(7)-type cytochrome triheme protein